MAVVGPITNINEELIKPPKKDNRRLLYAVYRVPNLGRTIAFYTECFGMELLKKIDVPEKKYSKAILGFGQEESNFVVKIIHEYGMDAYEIGTGFGHFAISTTDVCKTIERVKAKGGKVTKEPYRGLGGATIAFVKDLDGFSFELIQSNPPYLDPLCQVMLNVSDIDRSINFYQKVLGMKQLLKVDVPEDKVIFCQMGYIDNIFETTVLELTYNYGVTVYTKGNAYSQVAISTDDVCKSVEAVTLVSQELGGKLTQKPGKITSFLDPDGWETVLIDNEEYIKELERKE